MGSTFRDADLAKLRSGMLEEDVISTLKAEPTSRSDYPDGKYLLQWMDIFLRNFYRSWWK